MKGSPSLIPCTWILHRRAHSCKASCTFHCAVLNFRYMGWHRCVRAQQKWRILEYLRHVEVLLWEQIVKVCNINFWETEMSWNQRHSDNSVLTADIEILSVSQRFYSSTKSFHCREKKWNKKVSSPAPKSAHLLPHAQQHAASLRVIQSRASGMHFSCHLANGSSWERGGKKIFGTAYARVG